MNRKQLTVLIDLTTVGTFVDVPINEGPERDHAIKHNAEVRLLRALQGEHIAKQAARLNVRVHVGLHGVLLRGPEDRVTDIEVPACVQARDASDRWMPYH